MNEAPQTMTDADETENSRGIVRILGELPRGTIVGEEALARMSGRQRVSVKRAVERGELPPPVRMFGKPCWTVGAIVAHVEARLERARRDAEKEAARIGRLSP